ILATVEIAAPPERVFRTLASQEVLNWWVLPGVFDTREWSGEVRKGGRWRAAGVVRGLPYALEGEYLVVDPPTRLVHTWRRSDTSGATTTVTYLLQAIPGGTRLTLRHTGFAPPDSCSTTCQGWEASLARLARLLSAQPAPAAGPEQG